MKRTKIDADTFVNAKSLEWNKSRKESSSGKRFYTSRDMAIIKMDQAKRNAEIKRGVVKGYGNEYISVCGCGVEGCFIHSGYDSVPQEQMNEWEKQRFLDRNKKR